MSAFKSTDWPSAANVYLCTETAFIRVRFLIRSELFKPPSFFYKGRSTIGFRACNFISNLRKKLIIEWTVQI